MSYALLACNDNGRLIYTKLCLKKPSPLFLAVTPESILGYNIWHICYRESKQSTDAIISHHN